MAGSKIAENLEKVVNGAGKAVGRLQVGVNKILWGRANTQPAVGVQYVPATSPTGSASINYSSTAPTAPQTAQQSGIKNFAQSGLFNILNALNSVDLCAVITYAYDNTNIKKKKRPEKPWKKGQELLYGFQDTCGEVVKYIDKYTAYPNVFIGSYLGVGPNAVPPVIASEDNDAPVEGGTQVQKYNTYFLMQAIKGTLTFGESTGSLFTSEDAETIRAVPGLVNNLNYLKDQINVIDRYTDYRQIPDVTLQKIIVNIGKIRTTCVTIQNLDFRDPRALANLAGNYLGTDIRSQIQKLNKFVDVTKIIPTLKQVNDSLRSFIRIANQVQGIVNTGQFIIKLCLLFYKVFKFILTFFKALVVPLIFGTAGTQITLQETVNRAKDETDGVVRTLRALNALLSVVLVFIKYLLGNTVELLRRLETLLAVLRGCEAMKGSDVLFELEQTNRELLALKDRLETYILDFEGKTDPNLSQFGKYQIRVVDEEVVETTVRNRRRRGIALDTNGAIVTQSDLTFATNSAIIIEEVKQKLVSLGLVNPVASTISPIDLQVFTESYNYLDNNDILDDNLTISEGDIESADNLDENQGLGLQAFVNNLKGGKRLRRRMRKQLAAQQRELRKQLDQERQAARNSVNSSVAQSRAQGKTVYKYSVRVTIKQGSIETLPIKPFTVEATSVEEATTYAKKVADPRNQNSNWIYTIKQI